MKRILTALFLISAPAFAQESPALPPDATEAETAAYAVLDKHCARCHQDGALKDGLTKAKSGFGHVLDLRRLAQDTKFVVQGEPVQSELYSVIGEYAFPAMPDDCTQSDCFPTDAETRLIADWITSLGQVAPPPRPDVSLAELFAMARRDLQGQPTNRRERIRYLSLRAVWNDDTVSDENFDAYRAATVKLLNALSWNPTPFRFEQVDDHGVLIRVFMPDLDWDHATWALLEARYPYAMTSSTDGDLGDLQAMAATQIPVIRADWFAATAPVSPLYYDILRLPDSVAGLEQLLGIDMRRNILNEQVVRAGFQNSGVSTHNRLIERHAMGTGFFWTSYDFAGSKQRQSFFEYPLGPQEVFGPDLAFLHDGGRSIFTLPNGFHAYYLNTAEGERLDVGPTSIVRDDDYTDGTGEVVNGISCISCHSKGMRLNEDAVRDVALADMSLSAEARQMIGAIYPGQDAVAELFEKDMQQFFAALDSAGIDPDTTAGGLEPVRGLFVYHEDRFINFDKAASEVGLTSEELRERMAFVGADLASLMLRLDRSPIARDEWAAAYPEVLEALTDYTPIRTDGQALPAQASFSVRQVLGGAASSDKQQTGGHLTVYTDRPAYQVGDAMQIIIEPRADCRLTLISVDDRKRSCVLYPFPGLEDAVIPGGSRYVFPPRGALRTTEAGRETVLAICNGSDEAIAAEQRDTAPVSCAAGNDSAYRDIAHEVLSLDLGAEKTTGADVTFRAMSRHNPDVAKAQVSVEVHP